VTRRRSEALGPPSLSRRASTGDTRDALRAGATPATTVTSVPMATPAMRVRGRITAPVLGRSVPNAATNARRPVASTRPRPIPATEAIIPMTTASVSTESWTWPRLAPSARSRPSSRVR
jgi:hypothetical protein